MRHHGVSGALAVGAVVLLGACDRPLAPERRGCEGLTGTYLAHAEQLSGCGVLGETAGPLCCGVLGDGTGPLPSFEDSCTGERVYPSTTGTVTWTTEASYAADGSSGEASVSLVRTGINPCASDYAVTFTRQP